MIDLFGQALEIDDPKEQVNEWEDNIYELHHAWKINWEEICGVHQVNKPHDHSHVCGLVSIHCMARQTPPSAEHVKERMQERIGEGNRSNLPHLKVRLRSNVLINPWAFLVVEPIEHNFKPF